jgi:MoaA/NifB/PqqE/SkfB family radical SAM enzyme
MALDLEKHLVARANEAFQPLTANFELTPLCNQRCEMCFIRSTRKEVESHGGLRPATAWLELGKQLQQMGTLFILLTGGEPMLHPEFPTIYTSLRDMGFILTLNTNGTLITEEMCRETFRAKPRRVNVTLYGSNADTYERLCHHRDGFEQTMRGLRLLREYDIDTKLNLSMVKANSEEYEELMSIADTLGIPVVSNSYMFPISRGQECFKATGCLESRLTPEEAARFETLHLRYKKGDEYENFARQAVFQAHKTSAPTLEGTMLNCRAARSSMWVSWHHHVSPCVMMETPCVDLPTGTTHPFAFDPSTPFAEEVKPKGTTPSLTAGDLSAAWKWLTATCQHLPPFDDCSGCHLKHICQVCYAAALHEKRQCGTIRYLCDMAQEEINILSTHA